MSGHDEVAFSAATQPDELTYDVVDLLLTAASRTSAAIAAWLIDLELTPVLANALWQLDPDRAAPSMRSLAVSLRCDPSTVTLLVDKLERRGLARRTAVVGNRRVKLVALTPEGRRVRRELVEAATYAAPTARLSRYEHATLRDLLAKSLNEPTQDSAPGSGCVHEEASAAAASTAQNPWPSSAPAPAHMSPSWQG
ncbi:MarR family winged helix-turn-helix transcriptional regulator [Pseudonocardia nigra]|uniref:MarR family winged helix-turn-helix transcriptional regulator n=1 Tax=Pseudonocardia nigra TaxID=1921578 RepID=UPI001C5DBBB2|nr:MarR family transcriptional regulator [Pseudonocardia nigra]